MRVLSYGAGVDSTALLQLAIEREVPKPDVVVFADTQAESASTLATIDRMYRAAEKARIPTRRITAGDLKDWRTNGTLHAPLHFVHTVATAAKANRKRQNGGGGQKQVKAGDNGLLRRTCTSRFKIEPVRYFARDLRTDRAPLQMALGITLDEAAVRMGDSQVKYIQHEYPLVDLGMTGASCEAYLAERSIEAHKSACVMCPLSSLGRMNKPDADDRDMAVAYDQSIRNALPDHPELFVDRDMVPLSLKPPDEPFTLFDACPGGWC